MFRIVVYVMIYEISDIMRKITAVCYMFFASLFLLLFCSICDVTAQSNNQTPRTSKIFRAGASKSNITPPLGLGLVGGYGIPPPAKHVHDELHARSLVLDDGTTKLVFVVVDNISIRREVFDAAKQLIHERTGLPKEHLLMSAIHTHSATSANGEGERRRSWNVDKPFEEYQLFLIRRIADGVQIALNNLEPARIGWGVGQVPQHVFNRRWIMKEPVINPFGEMDRAKMNPGIGNPDLVKPAGPTDPNVSFISIQSIKGRPIALLGNYSLHYVGGVPKNDISADYFAVFADRIQELLGADRQDPPFVGVMSNGTSGDVNNMNYGGSVEKHVPYEKMRLVADDVAQEVFRIYKTIDHHDWVPLKAVQSELTLQVRQATPKMLANAKKILERPDTAEPLFHPLERAYAERTIRMNGEWPKKVDIILQTFRIGDLGIAAVPFETFAETGLEIKDKSPFKPTFTIELANGNYDYLPTPEQHELGGYEAWYTTNKVEESATQKIVDELISLFSTLE